MQKDYYTNKYLKKVKKQVLVLATIILIIIAKKKAIMYDKSLSQRNQDQVYYIQYFLTF